MLDYTRKFKNETAKLKLDYKARAMAELMLAGWSEQDAFIVLELNKPHLSDDYNKRQLESITLDDNFLKYMEQRQKAIKRGILKSSVQKDEEDDDEIKIDLLDKESVLKEMIKSAMSLPVNDINRINILQKYSELQQMKKDEVKEEDTTVHYYLPLSCYNCSLFLKNKKKSDNK